MKASSVSVILPSYNERDNLLLLIPRIRAVFRSLPAYACSIVVVDDDSPDGTARAVEKRFGESVRVIRRKGDRGLASAIGLGIKSSAGDIVIGMDADGNHDPSDIPSLIAALETADLAVASRFLPGGDARERFRFMPSYAFNTLLRAALGFPLYDNTSGFYAIRRKTLGRIGTERVYSGYGEYHLRLVYLARARGATIREIPTVYGHRAYGQSKSNLFIMAITYLLVAVRLRLAKQ